jgi:PAS domain S-box-containing protein
MSEQNDTGRTVKARSSPSADIYRKMVEEIGDYAIILLDPEGIIRSWNLGAEAIKKYKASEAIGKSFKMFYLPEDVQNRVPDYMLDQARNEGRAIREGWRVRKDGSKFWGSIILTALHGESGEIVGFSKVTRDLTERKLAEDKAKENSEELQKANEDLRRSEERYHRMISEVQDYAIILLNEHGEIQNWNAGAQKIKEYTAEEILGKNFRIFYEPGDQQAGLPEVLLKKAIATGKATHEGWRVKKSGARFWGSIVITALHNDRGEIIGFSKVTRDLTDKKLAEERQNKYLLELEAQNRELERFAYIASHDLQEPLRKIRTFVDLISDDEIEDAQKKKYFAKIDLAAERMTDLIKAILDYSKLSKDAAKDLVDLNTILKEVLEDFEVNIQQKEAKIHSDHLPFIQGDHLQISQVFTNLIGNALKFSVNSPQISITAKQVKEKDIMGRAGNNPESNYWEISFTDNGIGFEQQYSSQIFTLFQRLHGKLEYSGTGIGLALCKRIMENHRGFISAEGRPDKGAVFKIYFPV